MQNLSAQWVNLTSLGGNIDPFNKAGENKKGNTFLYISTCVFMYMYLFVYRYMSICFMGKPLLF